MSLVNKFFLIYDLNLLWYNPRPSLQLEVNNSLTNVKSSSPWGKEICFSYMQHTIKGMAIKTKQVLYKSVNDESISRASVRREQSLGRVCITQPIGHIPRKHISILLQQRMQVLSAGNTTVLGKIRL